MAATKSVNKKSKSGKNKKAAPLTPREKRLLAALPEAKTLQDALIAAGYSEATAKSSAKRTIEHLAGKSGIVDALEKVGINSDTLAMKHKEGLEATKVISAKIVERGAGAADNDFIEVPDYQARHKHVETIHKLRGDFPKEKLDLGLIGEFTIGWKAPQPPARESRTTK